MSKHRSVFTLFAVLIVVSTAFAFGRRAQKDLLFCTNDTSPAQGLCILQDASTNYSTISGPPTIPHRPVYKGQVNTPCVAPTCPRWNGQVFFNQ